ncbi:MAG: GNAT family N-acetyltransferase [Deltaproteobacteria bacterium]|nr:GNAT family N-acetyltransferase [Deltaproteobacteria bacterium]
MTRFAVREATLDDATGIARAHTDSWQTSYRGILPDTVLDRIDVGQRAETRRRILRDRSIYQLVAYDLTHGDIVGFCDAGPARRHVPYAGELYAIYIIDRAKRYGLGEEMMDRVRAHFAASDMRSMIVWVLDNNHHARRFYEAQGGRMGSRLSSTVGGFPVVELSYVWEHL